METSKTIQVLSLAKQESVIRARDLEPHNIPRTYLSRLCEAGRLKRLGRGLYMLVNSAITTNHSLGKTAKRVPHGVICLLSALRFHGVTIQGRSKSGWRLITKPAPLPQKKHLCVLSASQGVKQRPILSTSQRPIVSTLSVC